MQQKIRDKPTPRQTQLALSAATANTDNDQTTNNINEQTDTTKTETTKHEQKLIVHYTYEKRLRSFAPKMHQNYENIFKNTNAIALKLVVGNRNRRNTKKELIHKRPKRCILQAKQIREKYLQFRGK